MLKLIFSVLTIFSLMLFSACQKKDKKVLNEIQKIAAEFEAAWNRHDPHALASMWAEDGNLINPWTKEFSGKDAIERHFAQEHADGMKNSHISLTVENVRLIDPDIAFVDADLTLTGMTLDGDGEKAQPLHDHAVFLMVKKDDKWLILIARPY